MVAADERLAVWQAIARRMGERRPRPDDDVAAPQKLQVRVERDLAERDDDAHVGQRVDLGLKVGKAPRDLLRRRLVVGRRTPDRRGDECITEDQAVVRIARRRDVREAGAMERAHEKVAGSADAVAGKDAAGAVRAVRGRRQADEQQPRARIAEARDRLAPVGLVAIGAPLLARDLGAVAAQPRARLARDDRVVTDLQRMVG